MIQCVCDSKVMVHDLCYDAESRWKLLDFALLKRSSVSFFEVEKPESALSRWSRARTKAAKVKSHDNN